MRVPAMLGLSLAVACSRSGDLPRVESDAPPPNRSETISVTEKGLGNLMVGMDVPHADAILKTSLAPPAGIDSAACRMATWPGAPAGVSLMIEGGRIVRVDVDSGAMPTAATVRIGDTEDRVKEAYPGRVAVSPHKYTAGHYLTVTPENAADSAYRLVFETDGRKVLRYRGGQRPQVEYVERCG
jgi:hypothetical protein